MDANDYNTLGWTIVIALGILYYIYRRIKNKSHSENENLSARNVDFDKIISDYGIILEQVGENREYLSDIRMLPYSKNEIKSAIINILLVAKPEEPLKAFLVAGYLSLANFQENITEDLKHALKSTEEYLPEGINPIDDKAVSEYFESLGSNEIDKLWQETLKSTTFLNHPAHKNMLEEQAQLSSELKKLGIL